MSKIIIFHEIWLGMVPRTSGIHSRYSPMSKNSPNIAKKIIFHPPRKHENFQIGSPLWTPNHSQSQSRQIDKTHSGGCFFSPKFTYLYKYVTFSKNVMKIKNISKIVIFQNIWRGIVARTTGIHF